MSITATNTTCADMLARNISGSCICTKSFTLDKNYTVNKLNFSFKKKLIFG